MNRITRRVSNTFSVKRGVFVELPQDVEPLPKGIYRVENADRSEITLRIGKRIYIFLQGNWQKYIKPLPQFLARQKKTSEVDFLDRYYDMLEVCKENPARFTNKEVITGCFLDPSLARELPYSQQQEGIMRL